MGGKKKAAAKKKEDDAEDESMPKFMKAYKKKIVELECEKSKCITTEFNRCDEEGEKMKKFHIWDELGWVGTKAITDCLTQVSYPHC